MKTQKLPIILSAVVVAVSAFGMTACGHTHSYGEWSEKLATCTEDGAKTRTCSECGDVQTEVIPALGHSAEVIPAIDATCLESGLTEGSYCSVCGATLTEQLPVEPLGHDFVNGKCSRCGIPEFTSSAAYDYEPHVSSSLPRISVVTADGSNDWATVYFPYFDNYNAENNIDWQYQSCTITVDGCEEEYQLDSIDAQIKVRGNWTTTYDKKPFRIKFSKKQQMLGLNGGTKYKNWVLLANYKDISLMRNSAGFYLGNMLLGSDGYYCSDYRDVELYLNGQYWGVYLLCEQQQVNTGRVDVNEPEDGYTGTDIGYMVEFDGYYQLEIYNERFSCDYNNYATLKTRSGAQFTPDQNGFSIKNDIYDEAQKQFIKSYINNVYKICYEAVYNKNYLTFNADYTALVKADTNNVYDTVSKVIKLDSLVDTYILNEIACDYDISWSSFFMAVDMSADGDKILQFEAPWDFDSAFGLRDACASGTGLYAAESRNPWLVVFINESWFWEMVKNKWQDASENGVFEGLLSYLNNLETTNKSYFNGNFSKWGWRTVYDKVNGEFCWQARQVSSQPQAAEYLCDWLTTRINYLDSIWGN